MKESDLFQPVKDFLLRIGCTNVYGEVLECDVVGVANSCNIIVELKTSFSFVLLDQAIDRIKRGLSHYVYIAIPHRKKPLPRSAMELLKKYGIGVVEVRDEFESKYARVTHDARYNREATKRYKRNGTSIRNVIREHHANQCGGVTSSEVESDYSVTIKNIKDYLKYGKRREWATVDEILDRCETHYANPKPSVTATLRENWNDDWVETKKENGKRYFRYTELSS